MKYELETIPVWDAYQADTECPLCLLMKKAEEEYVNFFLGNSVMVPEMRVEVNKTGFCTRHFHSLFRRGEQRQHLGLLTHTRFNHLREDLEKVLSSGKGKSRGRGNQVAKALQERLSQCMICRRMGERLKRYAFTIIYHWKKDPEFRETFAASRGFCLFHLAYIYEMAEKVLKGKTLLEWQKETAGIQRKNMGRLEEEIHWYTQKFEFGNRDEPWGSSKDALERGIQKMTGRFPDKES